MVGTTHPILEAAGIAHRMLGSERVLNTNPAHIHPMVIVPKRQATNYVASGAGLLGAAQTGRTNWSNVATESQHGLI